MGAPVTVVPLAGLIAARPRREDLFDRELMFPLILGGTAHTLWFFQNTTQYTDTDLAGIVAKPAGSTNLVGNGGSLPRGNYFRCFGLKSYVSSGPNTVLTSAVLDDVRKIVDTGWVQFLFGATPYMDIPFHRVPFGTGLTGPVSTAQVATTFGAYSQGVPINTCYFDLTVPTVVRQKHEPKKVCIRGRDGKPLNVQVAGGAPTKAALEKAVAALAPSASEADKAKVAVEASARIAEAIKAASVREVRVPRAPIELAETESFAVALNFPQRPPLATTGFGWEIGMNLVGIWLKPLSA